MIERSEARMFGLKLPELLIIFAVLLLIFGAKRLPDLGRSLGGALRDFKRSVGGEDEKGAIAGKTPAAAESKSDA